jgi:hypothetical protein
VEEMTTALTEEEAAKDKLYRCKVARTTDGENRIGTVTAIDIGNVTGERLYFVEYGDGTEAEHLTVEDIAISTIINSDDGNKREDRMKQKKVAPPNGKSQRSFAPGDRVRLVQLVSQVQLNGQEGTVLQFHKSSGRWAIRLGEGQEKRLKPENLELARGYFSKQD